MTRLDTSPLSTRRPPKPRRWRRRVIGLLLALIALILGLGVWLLLFPAPIPGLRHRVEEAARDALGSPVTVESARLWVFERQIVLHGVTTGSGNEAMTIEELRVAFNVEDWRVWESMPDIVRLEVRGVRGAEIQFDHGGVHLAGVPEMVLPYPEGRGESLDLAALRTPAIRFSDVDLRVTDVRPSREVEIFSGVDLGGALVTAENGRPQMARVNGSWLPFAGAMRPFRSSVEMTEPHQISALMHLEGFNTSEMFPLPGQLQLAGDSLNWHTIVNLTPNGPEIDAAISGDELRWGLTPQGIDPTALGIDLEVLTHSDVQPSLQFRLRLDESGDRWVLDDSSLQLTGVELHATGQVLRQPGWPMQLELSTDHAPLTMDLLNIFLNRYQMHIDEGNLALTLMITGLAADPSGLTTEGRLNLAAGEVAVGGDINATADDVQAAIRFLRSDTHEDFWLDQLTGHIGGVDVLFSGGHVARSHTDSGEVRYDLTANCRIESDVAELAAILPSSLSDQVPEARGHLTLDGTVEHVIMPGRVAQLADLEPPNLDGRISLADVSVVSPGLGGEVVVPRGEVEFTSERLGWDMTDMTVAGLPCRAEAQITGERFFWRAPSMRLTAEVALDIGEALDTLPPSLAEMPLDPSPEGRLIATLTQVGPLLDASQWRRDYVISPDNLAFGFPVGRDHADVLLSGGRIRIAPETITAQGLGVQVNGEQLTVEARVTPRHVSLEARGRVDAGAIAASLPTISDPMIFSGLVDATLRADFESRGAIADMTDPAALAALVEAMREPMLALLAGEESPGLVVGGEFDLLGCTVMPKTAPADITNMVGRATWDGRDLTFLGGRADFGSSENIEILSGSLHPFNPIRVEATVSGAEVDMTEWVRPWRRRGWEDLSREEVRHRVYDLRGAQDRVVINDLTILADTWRWRELVGRNGAARVYQEFRRADRTNEVRVEPISVAGYGGIVEGAYRLMIDDEGLNHEFDIRVVEPVNLEPFLVDLRGGNPTQVQGLLTGWTEIARGPEAPWTAMEGRGQITVERSSLMRSTLFRELNRLTGIDEFENISFSTVTADLDIGEGGVQVDNLLMDTTWTDITGSGRIGFDRSISFDVRMEALGRLFGNVPLIGTLINPVTGLLDDAINTVFLTIRVDGTLDEPSVRVAQPLVERVMPRGGGD